MRWSRSLLGLLLILACSKSPQPGSETSSTKIPIGLIVEQEISGTIYRRSLSNPYGLAVNLRGGWYLCDAGNNRVIRFNDKMEPVMMTGGYGSNEGYFNQPTFLVVDKGLNLLISDAGNRRLTFYDQQLNFASEISLIDEDDPLKFGVPSGVALTDYGEVWVCDIQENRLAVFDNIGQFQRFVGDFGYSGGQLYNPEKIIVDHDNNFIVCDAGNRRIVIYNDYGNFEREIKLLTFRYPSAACVSNEGNLWVIDSNTGKVSYVSMKGPLLFETGPTLTGANYALKNPSDIVQLPDGRLIISDTGNDRVLICRILYDDA